VAIVRNAARWCDEGGCARVASPRSRRCDDHRRSPAGRERPSRTAVRPGKGQRANVYACITEAEWVRLFEHQGGACNICRRPMVNRYEPGSTEGQLAYLDHDHKLEKVAGLRKSVRGLLCLHCNRYILVVLHDNAEKAWRAYEHLSNPPARRILEL